MQNFYKILKKLFEKVIILTHILFQRISISVLGNMIILQSNSEDFKISSLLTPKNEIICEFLPGNIILGNLNFVGNIANVKYNNYHLQSSDYVTDKLPKQNEIVFRKRSERYFLGCFKLNFSILLNEFIFLKNLLNGQRIRISPL